MTNELISPMPVSARKPRKKLRRIFFWLGFAVAASLVSLVSAFVISGWEAFGGKPDGERLVRTQQSPEWRDGHFKNPQPIWSDIRSALLRLVVGSTPPGVEPNAPIPIVNSNVATFATPPASGLRVTWFGHSSALIEIDGSKVLIDPLWSERASPVPWVGPKRWFPPPVALSELPAINVVVISHDHYDHLDYASISAMKSWRSVFVVPLGLGAHLSRWGIPESRIIELDWMQSTHVGALKLVATPARHASGRISTKSSKTLWAGYAIIGPQHRAWYSGDTGFHADLGMIGERLGPFDVTLIETGQYDALWPDSHLGPELAVEAHRQVRGKIMIPVHWALIKLANHAWTEPVERVLVAARCYDIEVLSPRPGESIEPTQNPKTAPWWPQIHWQSASQRPIVATKNGVASDRIDITPCLK